MYLKPAIMRLLTATALLMNNHEVAYNLFYNPDSLRYLFYPASVTAAWYEQPSFWLYKNGDEWKLAGAGNEEIKEQAIGRLMSLLGD